MSIPETLFVYRLGKFHGEFRARCVVCDSFSPNTWDSRKRWRGFELERGLAVEFRQAVSNGTGDARGPASVYADEPCCNHFSPNDSIALMKAQNYTYLILDDVPKSVSIPFFISTLNPSTPIQMRVDMDFQTTDVLKLPEVADYENHLRIGTRDRWDSLLVAEQNRQCVRFPIGVWLPASFNDGSSEATGVFTIVEWLNEERAIVDVYCSDRSVSVDSGCHLSRRFRGITEENAAVEIGTILNLHA